MMKMALLKTSQTTACLRLAATLCVSWGALAAGAAAPAAEPGLGQVPVEVDSAWIRQAVKGQSGTGGFMRLTSRQPLTLTGFRTPVAASAELHEMSMEGDVMRMRPIEALPLPAGQTVALQPGGHHLMLMGLKRPLPVGTEVVLTLVLRDASGRVLQQRIKVPVLLAAPAATVH